MCWAEEGPRPRCKLLRGHSQRRSSAGFVPAAGNLHSMWKRNGCGRKPRDVIAEVKGSYGSTGSLRLQIFKTVSRDEGEKRGEPA